MASPSARVRLICCFHLCAIPLWIFMVHSDLVLPEGEHLDSWDCFTHGFLSLWKSTATLLPCRSVGRLMFCLCWRLHPIIHGLWSSAPLPVWGLPGIHYSVILSTCWLCGGVLLKSWPFAWLALPFDQLIAWHWLPTALSICWMAHIASLLSLRSDCAWPLAFCCPVSRSGCLTSPSRRVHLLTSRHCSSAAWHTSWLLGTALSTCWMPGMFLLPSPDPWIQCPFAALGVCLLTDTCSFAVLSTCFYAWHFCHIVLPTCLDFVSKCAPIWKN